MGKAGCLLNRAARWIVLGAVLLATPVFAFKPSAKYAADPRSLGIQYKDVSFKSTRDSVTVHGWWFAGRDSSPILVVCPSETGNMADKLPSVREWVARGFSVLAFDLRDSGPASAGDVDSLHDVVFASSWVNDTEGALQFARSRAGGRAVTAWGQDLGGALAFSAAGRQRGNVDAIAIEGLFRTSQEQLLWLGTSQDPSVVTRHRIMVNAADEPASVAAHMRASIFAVLAGKDEVTPPAVTQLLVARVPAIRETWSIPDAGHLHVERTPGYFDRVADALKRAITREQARWHPR